MRVATTLVVVEGGVILERNTRGTLVLTARRFGTKRAFFSCKNGTFAAEEGPFGLKYLQPEQVYHVYYTQETLPLLPQPDVVRNL